MNEKEIIDKINTFITIMKSDFRTGLYYKEYLEAIETALNLLEKKDDEIEKLKQNNKDLLRKLRNRVKEVKKLEKYSAYKKEFSTLNKQLRQKDKIIYETARTLSAIMTDIPTIKKQFERLYCDFINSNEDCCWKTDKTCTDCIKQYFERKANEI